MIQGITTLNLLCICLWIHNLRSAADLASNFVLKQDKYIVRNYVAELSFFLLFQKERKEKVCWVPDSTRPSWSDFTLMNLFQVNLKLKDQRALTFRNLSGTLFSEALISLLLWLTIKLSTVLYDKCTVQRCRVDVPSLIKHICCSCREVAHELWRWACVMLNFLFPWCSTLILYCDGNEGEITQHVIKNVEKRDVKCWQVTVWTGMFVSKLPACNIRETGPVLMGRHRGAH